MSSIPFGQRSGVGSPPDLVNFPFLVELVVRLLFEGWSDVIGGEVPPQTSEEEESMNGALAQGIRATIKDKNLMNVEVLETPGERSDPTLRLPDTEPDVLLIIAHFDWGVMLRAIIECKRLDPLQSPERSLRRDYVVKGMDRFIAERYGSDRQRCFMVAYVLRQDGPAAMTDVNTYLSNVNRTVDCLHEGLAYGHLGFVGESSHSRSSGGPELALLHAFLTFPD